MSAHPDRLTILMFVENDPTVDRASLAAHIEDCVDCTALVEEYHRIIQLFSEPDISVHFAAAEDSDRFALRESLLREYDEITAEAAIADAVFADLLARPVETWEMFFEQNPEHRTQGMARRLFEEAHEELDRRPEQALRLIEVAERIGHALPTAEGRAVIGDAWKQRSNALRQLFRYEEALDAAEIAEAFYASTITGAFDVAQAQYARAVTLFKMTRFDEALKVLGHARATLRDFGDSVPLAKTIMLEAGILIDQGDVTTAQRLWRDVLPMLEHLGDVVEQARVLGNLAECNLRLGDLPRAMEDAQLAVERYRAMGIEAERIRSEWTVGMVYLARGECDEGLNVLENAAADFETRGMVGDAGFVKLDICEELLRRGEWTEGEVIARELVRLFTSAGVTLASVTALDFLRQAVGKREATSATVQYVREYVIADDPARPFDPPS